ncbi:hypothetical protein H8A99_01585 [Bradyrhizobium sp. Arg68]|uniref:hypothetical protein n=1 Tax=Bradyrhizobium ivorense TaxID=2511166 RepID=UPI001E4A61FB|nr:hypothetical protein [Bradyrhizobium ivorense]MCC8935225.1 hypothetical protein [Bradyrhizobium ivorense]
MPDYAALASKDDRWHRSILLQATAMPLRQGGLSAAGSARRRCLDPLEVDLDFAQASVAVAIRCQVMHFATYVKRNI